MDILEQITKLRMRRGWTEYELAKRSDLPQSTISAWYSRDMLPSITSLEHICNGFDITPSQFFSDGQALVTLTERQNVLLCKYNDLTEAQREKLDIFLDGMLTR